MSPPRTPLDDAAEAAVKRYAADLQRQLDEAKKKIRALEGVDRAHEQRMTGHSSQHKITLGKVETTNGDLLAASTHLAGEIESLRTTTNEKLGFLYTEVEKLKHVPAQAEASAIAATQSKAVTSVVAQDTTAIMAKQKADQKMAWLRWVATIIPVLAGAIATIVQAFK